MESVLKSFLPVNVSYAIEEFSATDTSLKAELRLALQSEPEFLQWKANFEKLRYKLDYYDLASLTMSICLSQILHDACGLVGKLQDRDRLADNLISQAQSLHERISTMKQYQENLVELNDLVHHRPRSVLVHSLQQENRQIKILETENRQLRTALQEHQATLELVMTKYRQLILLAKAGALHFSRGHGIAESGPLNAEASAEDENATASWVDGSKLAEFAKLFDKCLSMGEASSHRDQEEIARLRIENESLRHVLLAAMVNDPKLGSMFQTVKEEKLKSLVNGGDSFDENMAQACSSYINNNDTTENYDQEKTPEAETVLLPSDNASSNNIELLNNSCSTSTTSVLCHQTSDALHEFEPSTQNGTATPENGNVRNEQPVQNGPSAPSKEQQPISTTNNSSRQSAGAGANAASPKKTTSVFQKPTSIKGLQAAAALIPSTVNGMRRSNSAKCSESVNNSNSCDVSSSHDTVTTTTSVKGGLAKRKSMDSVASNLKSKVTSQPTKVSEIPAETETDGRAEDLNQKQKNAVDQSKVRPVASSHNGEPDVDGGSTANDPQISAKGSLAKRKSVESVASSLKSKVGATKTALLSSSKT